MSFLPLCSCSLHEAVGLCIADEAACWLVSYFQFNFIYILGGIVYITKIDIKRYIKYYIHYT